MEVVLAHPDVRGLRHRMLATADAHGLYRDGFRELGMPETFRDRKDTSYGI